MISDGRHLEHNTKSDYDKVFRMLDGTGITMLGDHEEFGGVYLLQDRNKIKVGTASFDKKDDFLGGVWYETPIISGRALSRRDAINEFLAEVEKTHG